MGCVIPRFIERRGAIWPAAAVLAAIFGIGVLVSVVTGEAPTFSKHGPDPGPENFRRAETPSLYYFMTGSYALIAVGASVLAFYRFPRITLWHIRWAFAVAFLLLFILVLVTALRAP